MEPENPTEETVVVDTATVGCDGGGGTLGHPKVFLKIGDDGEVVCPYCSRRYLRPGADGAPGL